MNLSASRAAAVLLTVAAVTASAQSPTPAPPQGAASVQKAPAAPPPSAESVAKAEQVLAEARKALGGDTLASLRTLVANGHTRRVRGNNLVPIEFEIFVQLPDKYVRVDEFPAEDTDPSSSGFNGDALIQVPPPSAMPAGRGLPAGVRIAGAPAGAPAGPVPPGGMPPGGRGPAMDPTRARVQSIKQDFTRLALGLLAASPALPLTFSYAAIAQAPQGKAHVLDAKGDGLSLRFFVNSETHLPIMVTWTTPPTNVIVTVPGQPQPATVAPGAVVVQGPPAPAKDAPKEDLDKYAKEVLAIRAKAQATPVEHRLYFGEYRQVNGLQLPFRLRRAIGQETTEETTFDRYRVNASIDARKFEPVK